MEIIYIILLLLIIYLLINNKSSFNDRIDLLERTINDLQRDLLKYRPEAKPFVEPAKPVETPRVETPAPPKPEPPKPQPPLPQVIFNEVIEPPKDAGSTIDKPWQGQRRTPSPPIYQPEE